MTTAAPGYVPGTAGDDDKAFLILGVIPGGIGGNPIEPNLAELDARVGEAIEVDLRELEPQIKEMIGLLDAATMGSGFHARPADVRFGRISNMLGVTSDRTPFNGAGFHDLDTGSELALIYVDRPVAFSGSLIEDGTTVEYEIELRAAGFHWVEFQRSARDVFSVRQRDSLLRAVQYRLYLK